jgi:hypothetical protein
MDNAKNFDIYFLQGYEECSGGWFRWSYQLRRKKIMKKILLAGLAVGLMVLVMGGVVSAATITYNLSNDWSNIQNPNGVWSYTEGGVPITANLSDGANYNGWGNYGSLDGSILHWDTDALFAGWHDGQANDLTIHTLSTAYPYGGNNTYVGVTWTSPENGQVSIYGHAWDALFATGRNANWTLSVGGVLYAERTGVAGLSRNDLDAQLDENLLPGMSLNAINVLAGEHITFLTQTTTSYGHFMGVDMTALFTPAQVPEPSTMLLLSTGIAGLGLLRRRFKN